MSLHSQRPILGDLSNRISVLLPTFKRPALLKRAIDSVRRQTLPDFSLLISDNGDDDETRGICERAVAEDLRIQYTRNERNLGAVGNIRKLIDSVVTSHYCILSDDDFLFPNFLEDAMDAFRKSPHLGFTCSPVLFVDARRRRLERRNQDWRPGFHAPSLDSVHQMMRSHFTSTGVVFRRDIIDVLGGFHDFGDDRLFLTLVASIWPFHVSERMGAVFVVTEMSFSGQGGIGRQTSLPTLCDSLATNLSRIAQHVSSEFRSEVSSIFISTYVEYLRQRLRATGGHHAEDRGIARQFKSLEPEASWKTVRRAIREIPRLSARSVLQLGTFNPAATSPRDEPIDDCVWAYLQGDVSQRELFLRAAAERFTSSSR